MIMLHCNCVAALGLLGQISCKPWTRKVSVGGKFVKQIGGVVFPMLLDSSD